MNHINLSDWLKAALIRAVRTFAQTAAGSLGVAALLSDVSWIQVLSASLLSAILSLLMSIGGIPEAPQGAAMDESDRKKQSN